MIYGIGNRGCDRYRSKLSQALYANRARLFVELTYEEDVELWDIRRRRHEVTGIVSIEEAAHRRIGFRVLKEGLSDTPGDTADGLAARGFGVDDPAAVVGANVAVKVHKSKVGVDAYFGEYSREAKDRLWSFRDRVIVPVARQ